MATMPCLRRKTGMKTVSPARSCRRRRTRAISSNGRIYRMKSSDKGRVVHPFDPVIAPDSRVLILGSFPSVKSREQNFFYGHPQNRFWRVMAGVLGCAVPQTIPEKRQMLLTHKIALWDVLQSCGIAGSSDASIRNAVPNDIAGLLSTHTIRAVFSNGSASFRMYETYIRPQTDTPHFSLPSAVHQMFE